MNKEEFISKMKEMHMSEMKDIEEYDTMAHEAEMLGMNVCAGVLRDIKKDELSHANAIEYALSKSKY